MYVIMDLPLTTTSVKHPWFEESTKTASEYKDWYVWKTNITGINQVVGEHTI
jgi:glycosidase